jgi:hypothetical protein
MFASPVFWMHYSLAHPIQEQLVVNDIFYLRQLAPFLHGNGPFHILAISRYFQHVDRAVCELLRNSQHPLVLAGVPYYIPLYKELSRYGNICDDFVDGSVERRTPEEIHSVAWHVVRERFQEPLQKKIEQFQNVQGSGLTSDSLPDVLEAATEGRVDTLFLGNVHATLDHVSESMMNTAIRRALNSGAEIFESEDLLADPSQVRALLRF